MMDSIPRTISDLVETMMAKTPETRPQSMEEVQEALESFLGESVLGHRPVPAPARRLPASAIVAGILILAAGLAALILAVSGMAGGPAPERVALEEADAFAREHPTAFDEIADRYASVASSHPDTDAGREARKARDVYRKRKAESLQRDEKAASDRAEALYRKGDFDEAVKVLDAFRRRVGEGFALSDRFESLRAASEALGANETLSASLRFSEAIGTLESFPEAHADSEFGKDVVRALETARARERVLARASAFLEALRTGNFTQILKYVRKKRGPKEADLLLTAAHVIHANLRVDTLRVTKVTGRGRKVSTQVEGAGRVKAADKPWDLSTATTWIREGDDWVLENQDRGARWIELAVRLRTEGLVRVVRKGDLESARGYFKFIGKLERVSFQKIMRDLHIGSALVDVQGIDLRSFEVDLKKGTVISKGAIRFKMKRGKRETEVPWSPVWVMDGDTFRIFYLPVGGKRK
jgi:hypothetical protein